MTLDGFLAFLALVVAVFALMPIERRWMITLRGPVVWGVSAAALLVISYLELFSALALPCPSAAVSACRWLVLAQPGAETFGHPSAPQAAFLVAAAWLVYAGSIAWRQKVGTQALPRLAETVSEKLAEGRHEAVIQLVEPNLDVLDRSGGQKSLRARSREWLRRLDPFQRDVLIERVKAGGVRPGPSRLLTIASKIRHLIPDPVRSEEAAQDVFRVVFTSPLVPSYLAVARPKAGVRMLAVTSSRYVFDFSRALFQRMLKDPLSHLYRELPLNENVSAKTGYWLPAHNIYLHFLFADARNAERLGVCDDLSLAVREHLRDPTYAASLNMTARGFSDEAKWRDPTFATLRLFDIQARAVAIQALAWHASAFELIHLLEGVLASYVTGADGVDPYDEWPTRADYLIYTLFDALTEWAELPQHLDAAALHRQLESVAANHQNDSVPKSAMLVLGTCLRTLVTSEAVPERQRDNVFEVVLRSVADYPKTEEFAPFRQAYINALIDGGWVQGQQRIEYHQALEVLFHDQDHVLRERAADFAAAL